MALLTTRKFRRFAALACILLAGGGAFFSLGHLVSSTDPVAPADAVYVLGGTRVIRLMEAVRIYQEGNARHILLSRGGGEREELELERQGIHILNDGDIGYDLLVNRLHIPAAAVTVVPRIVDNTAQEAEAIVSIAREQKWKRLIVITDRPSSRRAGYAFRRLFGDSLEIIVTCSRRDSFQPGHWWATRWSFRATFYEAPKLIAYWCGLRG